MRITHQQHDDIQEAIESFGRALQGVRESFPYTAPELLDYRWQEISNLAVELVEETLRIVGIEETEYAAD